MKFELKPQSLMSLTLRGVSNKLTCVAGNNLVTKKRGGDMSKRSILFVVVCLFLTSLVCFETPGFAWGKKSKAVASEPKIEVKGEVKAGPQNETVDENDYLIAEVGPKKIYFSEINRVAQKLNRFLKENFETSQNWRLNFIRQYIAQIALAKMAEKEGLGQDKNVKADIAKAKQGILAEKLVTEKLAQVLIAEEDIQNYYNQNKDKYQIKEKIKIDYVKPKNQKDAEKMLTKLEKGKSFKKTAGRKVVKMDNWISEDMPGSPELEGVTPEDKKALFALEAGMTSQIMTNKDGDLFIFYVKEKDPAKDRPLEEVRRQVQSELMRETNQRVITDLVKDAFQKEHVTIYESTIVEKMPQKEE